MEHPYEYATMIKFFPVIEVSGSPNFADNEAQKAVSIAVGKFVADELPRSIATFPGANGWEVNSHSLTFVDKHIVISVLLQRPRT